MHDNALGGATTVSGASEIMTPITPNQWTILEALEKGPAWMRSFQVAKPLVERLIEAGLVERCRPHLGRARNMIRLTAEGEDRLALYGFAGELAEGASPATASRRIGRSTSFGAVLLSQLCALMGKQAA